MRQTKVIPSFGGIVTSNGKYYMEDNQVYSGYNLDLENPAQIKALPTNAVTLLVSYGGASVSLTKVRQSSYIGYESSGYKRDLVYWDGTNFKYVELFDGTNGKNSYTLMNQGNMALSPSTDVAWTATNCSMVNQGVGVNIGIADSVSIGPLFAWRKLESTQWLTSASVGINMTAGFRACRAACYNSSLYDSSASPSRLVIGSSIQWITGTGATSWEGNKYYSFRVSVLYQTGEESNLSVTSLTSTPVTDRAAVALTLRWYGYQHDSTNADIDPRIVGFRIYAAEAVVEGEWPEHRVIFEGNITDLTPDTGYTGSASWTHQATYICCGDGTLNDGLRLTYNPGATYEQLTGIPENIYSDMSYNIAYQGGSYMYVTGASPRLDETGFSSNGNYKNYIFRSKEYRYNMFNWLEDYVVMPFKVRGMAFYNGKLWAMDENHIAKINIEGMFIEDVYEIPGIENKEALLVTDIGLFFCNDVGAYVITDAGQIVELSMDIKYNASSGSYYWGTIATSTTSTYGGYRIGYDGVKNYICFFGVVGSGPYTMTAWAYHIPTKKWTYIIPSFAISTDDIGIFQSLDNRIYISSDSAVYGTQKFISHASSYLTGRGTTKYFLGDDVRDDKKFYKIFYEASGSPTIRYGIGVDATGGSGASVSSTDFKIPSGRKGKYLSLDYVLSSGATITQLGFIYRLLRGER